MVYSEQIFQTRSTISITIFTYRRWQELHAVIFSLELIYQTTSQTLPSGYATDYNYTNQPDTDNLIALLFNQLWLTLSRSAKYVLANNSTGSKFWSLVIKKRKERSTCQG